MKKHKMDKREKAEKRKATIRKLNLLLMCFMVLFIQFLPYLSSLTDNDNNNYNNNNNVLNLGIITGGSKSYSNNYIRLFPASSSFDASHVTTTNTAENNKVNLNTNLDISKLKERFNLLEHELKNIIHKKNDEDNIEVKSEIDTKNSKINYHNYESDDVNDHNILKNILNSKIVKKNVKKKLNEDMNEDINEDEKVKRNGSKTEIKIQIENENDENENEKNKYAYTSSVTFKKAQIEANSPRKAYESVKELLQNIYNERWDYLPPLHRSEAFYKENIKKIQFILTSFNTGDEMRGNKVQMIMRILSNVVKLKCHHGYDIDFHLIAAWKISKWHHNITNHLHNGCGSSDYNSKLDHRIVYWDNYNSSIRGNLSFQHRFVMAQNLYKYDAFIHVEDDMYFQPYHFLDYLQLSSHLSTSNVGNRYLPRMFRYEEGKKKNLQLWESKIEHWKFMYPWNDYNRFPGPKKFNILTDLDNKVQHERQFHLQQEPPHNNNNTNNNNSRKDIYDHQIKHNQWLLTSTQAFNQASTILTREQIIRFNDMCVLPFLSNFTTGFIERWSGGLQLYGGCGVKGVMEYKNLERYGIWHMSNSKTKYKNPNKPSIDLNTLQDHLDVKYYELLHQKDLLNYMRPTGWYI